MNKQQLDDAWLSMQDRLKQEPDSAKWKAFSERMKHAAEAQAGQLRESAAPAQEEPGQSAIHLSAPSDSRNKAKNVWSEWLHQRRRWIAGAAAAGVLGLALATPAGNRVFASLLNEFRMEQLTVVKEQDLEHLFHSLEAASGSTVNPYGEFAHVAEGERVVYGTLEEMERKIGREVLVPALFRNGDPKSLRVIVTPSHTITMKVNVNEINDTMRKLGAGTLLPQSIDGKQISLSMGKALRLDLRDSETGASYALTQQPAPSVSVEAGVPLAEALDAVLRFPLLPTNLKEELRQSHILDGGSAPLPVVVPDGYEQLRIAGTEVLFAERHSVSGQYTAVWVRDGQLFVFSGSARDRDSFTSMLTEMIGS